MTTQGSPYSIEDGAFTDNTQTSTLTIDKALYTDVTTFTCKISFTDIFPGSSDGLSISTAVHFRGEEMLLLVLIVVEDSADYFKESILQLL